MLGLDALVNVPIHKNHQHYESLSGERGLEIDEANHCDTLAQGQEEKIIKT